MGSDVLRIELGRDGHRGRVCHSRPSSVPSQSLGNITPKSKLAHMSCSMGGWYHSSFRHGEDVKRTGDLNNRHFDTDEYDDFAYQSFVDGQPWTYVTCPYDDDDRDSDDHDYDSGHVHERDPHTDAIFISVAGVCSGNGRHNAEAGYGVFFHKENTDYNEAESPPSNQRQTSHRAHLYACLQALRSAINICSKNTRAKLSRHQKLSSCTRLRHFVIKSHTDYVVKGMPEWVYKWEGNDYTNAKGRDVVNPDLFRSVHQHIRTLNDNNVDVDFWQASKDENLAANHLAQGALDGLDAGVAIEECEGNGCSCVN